MTSTLGISESLLQATTRDKIASSSKDAVALIRPAFPAALLVCKVCLNLGPKSFVPKNMHKDKKCKEVFESDKQRVCGGCTVLATILRAYNCQDYPRSTFSLDLHMRGKSDQFHILTYHHSIHPRDITLDVFSSGNCPWDLIQPTLSPLSSDTSSDQSIALICRWLETCVKEHSLCNLSAQMPPMPTRLLEILGPDNVRLRLTDDGMTGHYVCLSHCWGPDSFIRTTKSNLLAHQQSVPWESLPKNFQHAISVTYRLGLRWLWIDSLCIVQDDDDDWRHEGSKMDAIYSQSYLTIAATVAVGASQGFFSGPIPDISHSFDFQNQRQEVYKICTNKRLTHTEGLWPLLERAWPFQERLLSPRTVHFVSEEVLWECREPSKCECTRWVLQSDELRKMDIFRTEHGGNAETKRVSDSDDAVGLWHSRVDGGNAETKRVSDSDNAVGLWHSLVEHYSSKKMTMERDVLPALQGIAKYVLAGSANSYYAGLWDYSDLLWYSAHSTNKRARVWRAPSWSWACVSGQVLWPSSVAYLAEKCAKVLSWSTIPLGDDQFGEVKGGLLKLQGRCMEATLLYSWSSDYLLQYQSRDNKLITLRGLRADYQYDGQCHVPSGTKVRIIKVATCYEAKRPLGSEEATATVVYFLVLRPVSPAYPGYYERIGLLSYRSLVAATVLDAIDRQSNKETVRIQ